MCLCCASFCSARAAALDCAPPFWIIVAVIQLIVLLPRAGKLLGAFGAGWQVVLDRVAPSPDMAEAALQPVLATVTRLGPGHGAPPVQLGFAPSAVGPNAEQIADVCQVAAASPTCLRVPRPLEGAIVRMCQPKHLFCQTQECAWPLQCGRG